MSVGNLLSYSMCSEASKSHVTNLKVKINSFEINVTENVHLFVKSEHGPTFNFRTVTSANGNISDDVTPANENEKHRWYKKGFELRNWIEHFLSVLNHSKIDKLNFISQQGERSKNDYLRDSLEGFKVDCFTVQQCSESYQRSIFRNFSPINTFIICATGAESTKAISSALPHNLKDFGYVSRGATWNFSLDNLLLSNSRNLVVIEARFSFPDINMFLKHWLNGSNRRLTNAYFIYTTPLVSEDISKGLPFSIPSEAEISKLPSDLMEHRETMFQLKRKFDSTATIVLKQNNGKHVFNMFVEHF